MKILIDEDLPRAAARVLPHPETTSVPDPPPECPLQVIQQCAERRIPLHGRQVHSPHDVFGMLDATEYRSYAGIAYRISQELLVTITFTLVVRSLASLPDGALEGRGVEQEPALDVRIGNGIDYPVGGDHRAKALQRIVQFPSARRDSLAVRVCSHHQKVWWGFVSPLEAAKVDTQFRNDLASAPAYASGTHRHVDTIVLANPVE